METIMFAVGALTMVLLAVASLAVYSTVMVLKLKKESHIDRTEIWRQMHENHQMICRRFEDTQREMGDVYNTIAAVGGKIEDSVEQLHSYTDRRFDKLIDTHLLVKETKKESKQIING
jgi:hypothetical protein